MFRIVNSKYALIDKIGKGSFASVYKAINIENEKFVAIKVEKKKNLQRNRLQHELQIYQKLNKYKITPHILWYGTQFDTHFLVMDYMGLSFDKIFKNNNQKFSLKTVAMLAIDLLSILETFHDLSFIHRDLKPNNIVIGQYPNHKKIYLIDFGLSKSYLKDNKHIKLIKKKSLVGTLRYASIRTHRGYEQSRRDDIESLSYILIYLLNKGYLPWMITHSKSPHSNLIPYLSTSQYPNTHANFVGIMPKGINADQSIMPKGINPSDIQTHTKKQKELLIKHIKIKTSEYDLCKDIPKQFRLLLLYSKRLKFESRPNYKYLINLFHKLLHHHNLEYDHNYDWLNHSLSKK